MTPEQRQQKNANIKLSIQRTHDKRKSQKCSFYKIKLQENKLSAKQKEQLKMLFVEAKWLANSVINFSQDNQNKIRDYNTKLDTVSVKTKDGTFETRTLRFIGSQMKQSVVANMLSSIKTLSSLKKRGHKVGKLKFRKNYTSINLKQYKNTYKFVGNKFVRIQGVSGTIRVNGLRQFINDPTVEFANANILNTPSGYYLSITVYRDKSTIKCLPSNGKEIGIDFGCQTTLTTSEGNKINVSIEETESLKRLQRKLARQTKGSNNRKKTLNKLKKEYEYLSNRKNDTANKIVHKLLEYDRIYIQDEQLNSWKKNGHGKKVQHSILGRVKSKLKRSDKVLVLHRKLPTTKSCECGFVHKKISIRDRIFVCPSCHKSEDRDIHSAKNMIRFGKNLVPTERREVTPVDTMTSEFNSLNASHVREAGSSHPLGCV